LKGRRDRDSGWRKKGKQGKRKAGKNISFFFGRKV
jgi:hypothetical protein